MGFFKKIQELFTLDKSISDKNIELTKLTNEKQSAKLELSDMYANLEKISNEYNGILEKLENDKKALIESYREGEESSKAAYDKAVALLDEINKKVSDSQSALSLNDSKLKLYKSLIKKMLRVSGEDRPSIDVESLEAESEKLTPTVEIPLYSHNIKDLRSLSNENNKIIDNVLKKYESRYTTKTNRTIYRLMVLALRAELQNILINMKFTTLDKCMLDLNTMLSEYLQIAAGGSQLIAPTLSQFIDEISELFKKSIEIEYEYYVRKERIKEEQRALREQMRQEAEDRKRLEAERIKIEKEENKYNSEIQNIQEQINNTSDNNQLAALQARYDKVAAMLAGVKENKEKILKLQNGTAGNVYIISNLGSFGDRVFKIGMTRRTSPQDRVDELGDASVPFPFDVHSFIFSNDAVKLESEIHKRLAKERVNKINARREFFNISIDELENLVFELEPTAEFNKTMLADQYRQSLAMGSDVICDYVDEDEDEEDV